MSSDFISRLIGMVVFCIIGVSWGISVGKLVNITPQSSMFTPDQFTFTFGLVGALTGLVITPFFTVYPMRALRALFSRVPTQTLVASLAGLVSGQVIAALLAFPISLLPDPLGSVLPFVGVVLFGYLGVVIFVTRQNDFFAILSPFTNKKEGPPLSESNAVPALSGSNWMKERGILLDTSVIIDGRIADISHTGFLPGTLIIPRFVLIELQYIADSADNLRRQRGRRGMDVISRLQKEPSLPVQISDIDVEGAREVDDKLVILARQLHCPILTTDFNLNRIAELQGVTVLNVNDLANAVKSIILPGEALLVRVIQEGKESNQGVGYMDDGTMVVVENGKLLLNQETDVVVTKVLQTAAGRMIFARPEG